MVMSLILLAPSWGGMINGMMTLSGAWHKLRSDPILRFLVVSLAFYGMSTFEGPMMAIKTVNDVQHGADGGQPEVRVDQADAVHLRATEDFRDQVVERADGDHRHPAEGAGVHVADGPVGVVGEGVDGLDRMTVNHWVPGSSPGRGAKFQSGYSAVR